MFDNTTSNLRPTGVGIPAGQAATRGNGTKTLRVFVPTEMFVVQYLDEEGLVHETVVMKVGTEWWLPANGESWVKSVRKLGDDTWLVKQLTEAQQVRTAPLPKADAVDILPGNG